MKINKTNIFLVEFNWKEQNIIYGPRTSSFAHKHISVLLAAGKLVQLKLWPSQIIITNHKAALQCQQQICTAIGWNINKVGISRRLAHETILYLLVCREEVIHKLYIDIIWISCFNSIYANPYHLKAKHLFSKKDIVLF